MGVGASEVKGRTCMIKVEVEVTNEDGERRSCDKQMSRTHERLGPDDCNSNLNETSLSPSRGARFSLSFVGHFTLLWFWVWFTIFTLLELCMVDA